MEVLQTSALPLGDGAVMSLRECTRTAGQVGRLACHPQLTRDSCERRMERETGFEPATPTLARSPSTTELFPLATNPNGTTALPPRARRWGRSEDRRLRTAVRFAQDPGCGFGQRRVAMEPGGPLERAEPRHLGQDFDVPMVEIRGLGHRRA